VRVVPRAALAVTVSPRAGPLERAGFRALPLERAGFRALPLERVGFRVSPLGPVLIRAALPGLTELLDVPPEPIWFRAVRLERVARQVVLQAQFFRQGGLQQVAPHYFAAYWGAFHEQARVAQHGPRAVPLALAHQDERWELVGQVVQLAVPLVHVHQDELSVPVAQVVSQSPEWIRDDYME
jgi:hypothetical protein